MCSLVAAEAILLALCLSVSNKHSVNKRGSGDHNRSDGPIGTHRQRRMVGIQAVNRVYPLLASSKRRSCEKSRLLVPTHRN
ncbi:hypothetical protein BJY52DRAFT_835860 [Lactarius psammicola]|nr:hypothetical protein BJY52DRAFT_835860 [Lactarius psammicola]